MAKLVITGDRRMLEVIAKENRLRAKRRGIEISFEDEKPKATRTRSKKPIQKTTADKKQ